MAATGNPGKLKEFREILEPQGFRVIDPESAGWNPEVDEDQPTLEGNALKKAKAAVEATGRIALADDTGLFVDHLDGAPGIHSARYAGPAQDMVQNCAKLLRALEGVPENQREAQFRSVIVWADPQGGQTVFEGVCRGSITFEYRGEGGFGYDPVFLVEGTGQTFAEMSSQEKNAVSHRGKALQALARFIVKTGKEKA